MVASDLITPLSPWSLWVPLLLLAFIVLAAIWFARIPLR